VALGLRLVSICAIAAYYGAVATAHGETAGLLRPTINENEPSAEPVEAPAAIPSLTITPEEKQVPLKTVRPLTDSCTAEGMKFGGMTLYPQLEVGPVYTSNVAGSACDARSDFGLSVVPSLRFESDRVRHSWEGQALATSRPIWKMMTTIPCRPM
jgi:hypothetical protein